MRTVTPEKIDSARYPYFSPKAPLMGTLAIALLGCQRKELYHYLGTYDNAVDPVTVPIARPMVGRVAS